MNLGEVVASLPTKRAAVYIFERGKVAKHPYALLAHDIARALENLRSWGVAAGSRVGIFAPNSYHWLVYDLAMIEMGAVSVPFTDDFAGKIDRDAAGQISDQPAAYFQEQRAARQAALYRL